MQEKQKETMGSKSLGQEDPWEEGVKAHSSVSCPKNCMDRWPGGLQSARTRRESSLTECMHTSDVILKDPGYNWSHPFPTSVCVKIVLQCTLSSLMLTRDPDSEECAPCVPQPKTSERGHWLKLGASGRQGPTGPHSL